MSMFEDVKKSLQGLGFVYSGYFDVVDPLHIQDFKDEHRFLELKGFIDKKVVFIAKKHLDLFDALAFKDGIYYINEFNPDKIRLQCLRTGQIEEYDKEQVKKH